MTESRGGAAAGMPVDWSQIHARLESARRVLVSDGAPTPDVVSRILAERARRLARPVEAPGMPPDALGLLAFSRGGARYAVGIAHVLEASRLRGLVPLPCVPAFFPGVISHRGRVIAALDLGRLWGRPAGEAGESSHVVVVAHGKAALGLIADEIHGLVEVPVSALGAVPAGEASAPKAFVRGVTRDRTVVLDAPALLGDPRIIVNDEAR